MPIAVVTGAGSGIGRATAMALGEAGYSLFLAGRSRSRLGPVADRLRSLGVDAEPLILDLASLSSVSQAVRSLPKATPTIEVLVNNAGVGINRRGLTEDGFEARFGINHLGHFLLTNLLLPRMGGDARVVTVSSEAHRHAKGIDFRRVRRSGGPVGFRAYAVSKLANLLFNRELSRRHPGLRTAAVHPGLVDTGIIPAPVRPLLRGRLRNPEEGAATVVWCATRADLPGGGYYIDMAPATPSPAAEDDALAEELWHRSAAWAS